MSGLLRCCLIWRAQVGNGANMKLVVNMLLGTYMAASAEGLVLADALGLKQQDVVDVVALGAIATPMLALKVTTVTLVGI